MKQLAPIRLHVVTCYFNMDYRTRENLKRFTYTECILNVHWLICFAPTGMCYNISGMWSVAYF